jgi:hypothetical protein
MSQPSLSFTAVPHGMLQINFDLSMLNFIKILPVNLGIQKNKKKSKTDEN